MDPTEYLGSLAAESQLGGKHACGQSIQLPALKESQFKHHTTSNELKAFDLDDASQRFKCSINSTPSTIGPTYGKSNVDACQT